MEKLAGEYDSKFILAKVDVEHGKESAQKYGVSGIPAVKMFKDGEMVAEFTGSIPEASVKAWLDENL